MSAYNFQNILYFFSEDLFTFTNSVDPDEMQLYAAFHLGLHCLQECSFGDFLNTKGKCHLTVFDIISMHAIISTHYFSGTNITISMLLLFIHDILAQRNR